MNDESQVTKISLNQGKVEIDIVGTMPNLIKMVIECTELLKAHKAKNYVEFDMIARAESKLPGYRVTVQRIEGKSPAQRVIEMERELAAAKEELRQATAMEPVPEGTYNCATYPDDKIMVRPNQLMCVEHTDAGYQSATILLPEGWQLMRPREKS